MSDANALIRTTVQNLYELLVAGKYLDLAKLTNETRLSAADIERAVREYGRTLQRWPHVQEIPIDAVQIAKAAPRAWSVRADAYTLEEGHSDLTLEMTLIEDGSGKMRVELDDLHVL